MKKHPLLLAAVVGVGVWLLLRPKSSAASTSSTSSLGGFLPIGLASLYFDPGQTYTVNANVNSPDFGSSVN